MGYILIFFLIIIFFKIIFSREEQPTPDHSCEKYDLEYVFVNLNLKIVYAIVRFKVMKIHCQFLFQMCMPLRRNKTTSLQ